MGLRKKMLENAKEEAQALVEMYSAGFVDGFNLRSVRKRRYATLKRRIIKAFEKRFKAVIEPALAKVEHKVKYDDDNIKEEKEVSG